MDEMSLSVTEGLVEIEAAVPIPEAVIEPVAWTFDYATVMTPCMQKFALYIERTTDYPFLLPVLVVLFMEAMEEMEISTAAVIERIEAGEDAISIVREFIERRLAGDDTNSDVKKIIDGLDW